MYLKSTIILIFIYSIHAEEKWTGKWFPNNPNDIPSEASKSTTSSSTTEKWTGKWFPSNPESSSEKENLRASSISSTSKTVDNDNEKWEGKWFPSNPNGDENQKPTDSDIKQSREQWFAENPVKTDYRENTYEHDRIMGIPNSDCDDGEVNLHSDFDPSNADHTKMYTCLESASYKPNSNLEPIETIYTVPKFYTPVHKCMNETITYDQHIPTLGYHRPLWPVYGEYKYVPPQRWLHSLEHGAIVMLYDPCALSSQVDSLKNIVKSCLFRHVITPYKLSKERPLALVAWATSLEMSAFDKNTAVEFIKKYAKSGPEKVSRQGQYRKMLIEESKVVSDSDDSEVCGNISSMM